MFSWSTKRLSLLSTCDFLLYSVRPPLLFWRLSVLQRSSIAFPPKDSSPAPAIRHFSTDGFLFCSVLVRRLSSDGYLSFCPSAAISRLLVKILIPKKTRHYPCLWLLTYQAALNRFIWFKRFITKIKNGVKVNYHLIVFETSDRLNAFLQPNTGAYTYKA